MSFFDLLLADALATGLARALAEDRPPPENFFVIPPPIEAWLKIKASCKEENMVICVEVTEDSHAGCRQVQPLFMDLARKMEQIPFFRVKIGPGRTYNQLREDLGGIDKIPTVVVVFFDDGGLRITQVEGAMEVSRGIRSGGVEVIIRQYIDRRMKLKAAERLAGALLMGVVGQAAARRRSQLEYEERLKAEMEKKEREQELEKGVGLLALLQGLRIEEKPDPPSEKKGGATGRAIEAGSKKEGGEKSTCELCDGMFPFPVTFHMKKFHSGCGKSSNGMGFDMNGLYRAGWKGNCGEGGAGPIKWYLMCRECRAKYLRQK